MDIPERIYFTRPGAEKIQERGEANSGGWGGTMDVYITGDAASEAEYTRSDIAAEEKAAIVRELEALKKSIDLADTRLADLRAENERLSHELSIARNELAKYTGV